MTFQPIVPLSGYAGWRFLERTSETQRTAFNESAPIVRATDNFRSKIGAITTAEDLVNDRQLLAVALGAFGLDEDINNTFFIRKILEDGTLEDDALANKLADPRYAEFSRTFGFGDLGARTGLASFADKIVSKYETKQFELAVGEQDNSMRLALNFGAALESIVEAQTTNDGQWFGVMGNAPLREMIQTALGFPSSFATIDLDQQLDQFKFRSEATFGTDQVADITSPENQEKMIRLYMLRAEASSANGTSGASIALTLLQQT